MVGKTSGQWWAEVTERALSRVIGYTAVMATITQVVCDKCRSTTAVETIDWEIARETGQIDLCATCLRAAIRAVSPGRTSSSTGGTSSKAATQSGGQAAAKPNHAVIRAWAKKKGMKVPAKGRIPTEIVQAYNADRNSAPSISSIA